MRTAMKMFLASFLMAASVLAFTGKSEAASWYTSTSTGLQVFITSNPANKNQVPVDNVEVLRVCVSSGYAAGEYVQVFDTYTLTANRAQNPNEVPTQFATTQTVTVPIEMVQSTTAAHPRVETPYCVSLADAGGFGYVPNDGIYVYMTKAGRTDKYYWQIEYIAPARNRWRIEGR